MKEAYPLAWPEGRRRTLIRDRKDKKAWKLTTLQYKKALEDEFRRMGVRFHVVTSNVQPHMMGARNPEPPDPGVAVYFVRPPSEDDFSWQEVLGINNPSPKLEEIDQAFTALARTYHPDNQQTGDEEMYKRIGEARKRAKAWVTGEYGKDREYVVECDFYREVRWNIAAIRIAINAIRRIEECGASGILERTWQGFQAITENSSATA